MRPTNSVEFAHWGVTYEATFTVSGGSIEDVGLRMIAYDPDTDLWNEVEDPSVELLDAAQEAAENSYRNEVYWYSHRHNRHNGLET